MDLLFSSSDEGSDQLAPRPKCRYGASCYRKNPQHKKNFRHTADADWTDGEGSDETSELKEEPEGRGGAKRKIVPESTPAKKPKAGKQTLISMFENKAEADNASSGSESEEPQKALSDDKVATATKFPPTSLSLKSGELMHTTSGKSAQKRTWLAFTGQKTREVGRCYCSTDGSSTGWHACCVVPANSNKAFIRGKWGDMKGSRNVGAEAAGFLLGVLTLPSSTYDVIFLADFLNALAWDVGGANYKHEVLVSVYSQVIKEKARRSNKGKIPLRWDHIHHPGHQKDSCWFTILNTVADNVASCRCFLRLLANLAAPLYMTRLLIICAGVTWIAKCPWRCYSKWAFQGRKASMAARQLSPNTPANHLRRKQGKGGDCILQNADAGRCCTGCLLPSSGGWR
jgi:hypothetical protein